MNPIQQALQQQGQNPQPNQTNPTDQVFQNTLTKIRQNLSQAGQDQSQDQPTTPDNQQAAISQALGQLNDKSISGQVGKAIQTPNYAGYCLAWVDDQQGNANRQPTAIADYQVNASQNNIKTSMDAPKGARVYFNADQSNANMGHVGIANGDGTFTSATDNGIQTFDIPAWEKYSGQQYLGYATPQKTS